MLSLSSICLNISVGLLRTCSDRSMSVSCWWFPLLDAVLQVWFHRSRVGKENHLLWPTGCVFFHVVQGTFDFLGCKCTLLGHGEFSTRISKSFSSGTPLNQLVYQSVLILGFMSHSQAYRTFHLALVNFTRFTWAYLLSSSKSLWMASRPSGESTAWLSLLSASLLNVHSLNPTVSFMKVVNSIGLILDPGGAPLITVLHLDIELLTVTHIFPMKWQECCGGLYQRLYRSLGKMTSIALHLSVIPLGGIDWCSHSIV